MLKNQDAVPEPPLTVSQMRVTPDELTHALAAIEARRQADAGTIPLDQAVSELHLDSTSDEIWAEVQAQRAKAAAPKAAPQEKPQQAQPFSAAVPVVRVRPRGWRRLLAPVLVLGVLMSTGIIPHPWGHSHTAAVAPILRPLAAVPNGIEVYADDAALAEIAAGKPLSQVLISGTLGHNGWRLVKIGGHVYLRGNIASADSLEALQGKALNVYNDNNSGELFGESVSTITVRVDGAGLQKSGGDSDYSEVTLPKFQPDSFTTLDQ